MEERKKRTLVDWEIFPAQPYGWDVGEGGRYKVREYWEMEGKLFVDQYYRFYGNGYGNNDPCRKLFVGDREASEEEWEEFMGAEPFEPPLDRALSLLVPEPPEKYSVSRDDVVEALLMVLEVAEDLLHRRAKMSDLRKACRAVRNLDSDIVEEAAE